MNNSWIKLHRSISDWEWSDKPNVVSLFVHILLMANYEDKKWQGKTIKRGSLITSVAKLAKKVGLSNRQTRTSLKCLETTNEVTIKTNNKYTEITVNAYSEYQKTTSEVTNKRQTNDKQTVTQTTTTKEVKKLRTKPPVSPLTVETAGKKYSKISDLGPEDIQHVAQMYGVREDWVASEVETLRLYCQSKGINYKDYRATLQNWVRRDKEAGKAKLATKLTEMPNMPIQTAEERERSLAKAQEIKQRILAKSGLLSKVQVNSLSANE